MLTAVIFIKECDKTRAIVKVYNSYIIVLVLLYLYCAYFLFTLQCDKRIFYQCEYCIYISSDVDPDPDPEV